MATEYADFTDAKLDEYTAAFAAEYKEAARDRRDGAAFRRHVAVTTLHGIALELHARRGEAAAEPFTADEVRAEEALDAYMAGDSNA